MLETTIQSLGEGRFPSPLRHSGGVEVPFRRDHERVLYDHREDGAVLEPGERTSFEIAGPRERSSSIRRRPPRRSSPAAASARG